MTSPPYWGLRDYGTASWEGGEAGCDHLEPPRGGRDPATSSKQLTSAGTLTDQYASACGKCGARRIDLQLGLEPTPDLYVEHMVQVFREVRRVLRDDGTLWLNLGDSYNAYNGNAGPSSGFSAGSAADTQRPHLASGHGLRTKSLKPKDLVGIPWRVAFALQADGWYLRSDIIWAKPNPMPESVTDRPTKAHEYLFLLTKRERYYYDAEAIKEPFSVNEIGWLKSGAGRTCFGLNGVATPGDSRQPPSTLGGRPNESGRNRRSVWTIATEPYPEAHFATFPADLVKPCVLAGSKGGDIILDPFAGSGTTVMVAKDLGRHAIGLDLKPDYLRLAQNRTRQGAFVL